MELPALPPEVPLTTATALLLAALALVVLLLYVHWRRGALSRRLRAQWARAGRGEDDAEELLEGTGWAIEGRQVSTRYELLIDGQPMSVLVRADFIVRRGRRRYVAEVKTGRWAPRIETSATRRQLLEYRVAFAADGVLLVDVEAKRISFVEFPEITRRRAGFALPVPIEAQMED